MQYLERRIGYIAALIVLPICAIVLWLEWPQAWVVERKLHGLRKPDTVIFSPDSLWVVGNDSNNVALWNCTTGEGKVLHARWTGQILFASDDILIIASAPEGESVCSFATKTAKFTLQPRPQAAVFSKNRRWIVGANREGGVQVWDAHTGAELFVLRKPAEIPHDRTWMDERKEKRRFKTAWSSIKCQVSLSPDGRYAVTANEGGVGYLWNLQTKSLIKRFTCGSTPLDTPVHTVAFSPDAQHFVTTSRENMAQVWECSTGKRCLELKGEEQTYRRMFGYLADGKITSSAFSADGKLILTVSETGVLRSFAAATGRELQKIRTSIFFGAGTMSSDNRVALILHDAEGVHNWFTALILDTHISIWNAEDGTKTTLPRLGGEFNSAVLSPDGRMLVTGDGSSVLSLWRQRQSLDIWRMVGMHPALWLAIVCGLWIAGHIWSRSRSRVSCTPVAITPPKSAQEIRPRRFWRDWVALIFSAVGIVLMIGFVVTGGGAFIVDSSGGSSASDWLYSAIARIIMVSCCPVFGCVLCLMMWCPLADPLGIILFPVSLFGLQGAVFFLLGKVSGVCVRALFRRTRPLIAGLIIGGIGFFALWLLTHPLSGVEALFMGDEKGNERARQKLIAIAANPQGNTEERIHAVIRLSNDMNTESIIVVLEQVLTEDEDVRLRSYYQLPDSLTKHLEHVNPRESPTEISKAEVNRLIARIRTGEIDVKRLFEERKSRLRKSVRKQ
ncbi:MAG: WD40 repeat domain-containing protein [Verrucomicrobia bacterium]|nr:WD40 repeat domain-containing protein [Verrucomicrobiota bacterium]